MNSMIGRKRILLFGESANIRLSEKTFSTKHHDLQDKDVFHKQRSNQFQFGNWSVKYSIQDKY